MIYDTAIIGTGPAGMSAALNLKIHEKNFIWIGSKNLSDKIHKAEKISNYPGMIDVSGEEMAETFSEQISRMGISIVEQMVNSIMWMGEHYALLAGSEFYEAKTIILATGIVMKNTLEQEQEFLGKGVSYCATCDGGLYREKNIAVICNNKRFEHEVKYLADLAANVQYFPQYKDPDIEADNITIQKKGVKKVLGDLHVQGIQLRNGEEQDVDGVFILRDTISMSSLLQGLEMEEGHIKVDRQMKTNLPGVYAAGDCTGRPYQYTKAVGEGNIAAHSVLDYLGSH